MDIEADGCYHVSSEESELAVKLPKETHQASQSKKAFAKLAASREPPTKLEQPSTAAHVEHYYHSDLPKAPPGLQPSTGTPHETTLPNSITVYGTNKDVVKLSTIVEEFAELQKDKGGTIDLLQEDQMRIPLRPSQEEKFTRKSKVYHLGLKDRAIIDKVFNKL